jgi:hypothetical protein
MRLKGEKVAVCGGGFIGGHWVQFGWELSIRLRDGMPKTYDWTESQILVGAGRSN